MDDTQPTVSEGQQNQAFTPVEVQVGSRLVMANSELERRIWDSLKECYDPEIPVNIVDLGLVYDLNVDEMVPGEANAFVTMTLTAPGCGMGPMIAADVRRRVQLTQGVRNVQVEVVFYPTWNPSMMSEAARVMLNF
jgi:metal-sulfur cluster biosynthetic enzyme